MDAFEIQVYDGTANGPWVPGIELHVNDVASGVKTPATPELAPDHQAHFTLEPSLGITPWWELGMYLQSAYVPGSGLEYGGSKLRSKFVTPPGFHPHLRLGVNFELALVPWRFEADMWSAEVRPIVAWEDDRVILAVNPIVGVPLAGSGWRSGPTFEPAAMALAKIAGFVAVGLEYYAGFGPLSSPLASRDQEHYLYEAAHLIKYEQYELSVAVGEGLTSGSNGLVLRTILGATFDAPAPPRAGEAQRGK